MKITLESFLAVLGRSGLLAPDKAAGLLQTFQAQHPGTPDGQAFAEALVAQNIITPWQAEKLLQGKHKGFFLGKYRLLRLLGKGGMSSVYLAEHVLMRRRCAIKVLPAKRVNDTSYLGRFHREAQAVAALDHPNIVRAYDVDHEQDGSVEIHFLVMEYVDGLSLLDLVNRDGPLAPVAAAEYVRQAAAGLEHAHRAGLIHRDIKPGNLLVDGTGIVKVMDLGLARFFAGDDQESLTIQYDEKVLGTADYLAPEQAVDSHDIDARADIYSLGCTLYFLLTGHPPFPTGTLPQRLMAHQTKEPTAVEAERKDVPASLLAILKKMMAKQAPERYQTAGEVGEVCLVWLQEQGGAAWETIRSRLAESGIDLGGSSGRVGSSSSRISPQRSAQLAEVAKAASGIAKSAAAPPTLAVAPPKAAPPAAKSKPAPDDALGAFLSNLSTGGPPAVPVAATPKPTAPLVTKPATTKPVTAKPAATPVVAAAPPATPLPKAMPVKAPQVAKPAAAPARVAKPAAPREPAVAEAMLVEVVEAEPVAEAVATPAAASSVLRQRRSSGVPKQYLIYGGAAAALLVGVIGAVLVFSGGKPAPETPGASRPAVAGTGPAAPVGPGPAAATPVTPAAPPRPTPESLTELTVGPTGHFATIGEALAYAADNPPLTDIDEPRLIRVAGGATYAERLQIAHWGLGALHIKSEGAQPATLQPTGPGSVLTIDASRKVKLEGFTLDAAGQPDAITLRGGLSDVQLINLRIQSFTRTGVRGDRASGVRSGRLELRDLTFTSPQADAIAIHFQQENDGVLSAGTQFVTVLNNQFLGPLQTGLEIIGPQSENRIQKCRFHNLKTGLRLGWSGVELDEFLVESNTFHRVAAGLSVDQPPRSASKVVVRKNLFVEASQELAFDSAPDAAALAPLVKGATAEFNATDRPADAVTAAPWNLFATQGQTGVAADFIATDPGNDFLKPRNAALKVAAIPGGDKFIGAVPP